MIKPGKMWTHRCGHQLWAEVLGRFGPDVVVNYREGSADGVIVGMCPGCGGELRTWWKDPQGQEVPWPDAGVTWDGEAWVCSDGRRV